MTSDSNAARAASETPEPLVWAPWLFPLELIGTSRKTSAKRVGGKAIGLARLFRDGFPVPPAWVIESKVFSRLVDDELPKGHDVESVVKAWGTRVGMDRAARARERLLRAKLPQGLLDAIDGLWRSVGADAPWGFAVRSSATCEDLEETSLAGLAQSALGVRGPEAIAQAIREVYASAYLPRAIAYLAQAGVKDCAMAVVVQRMVPAHAAGVLFTGPPPGLEGATWARHERLAHATFGLGAPVVEGAASSDAVRFERGGGDIVAQVIADKPRAVIVGPEGITEVDVDPKIARTPAFGPAVIAAMSALADRLEIGAKGPFDVELAVELLPEDRAEPPWISGKYDSSAPVSREGKVWLLQARPLSGGGYPAGGDAETVWSRANVGEALPGAATPLTWSVAKNFADKGFREAFGALGCKVPKSVQLFGDVHGRFYLNLSAFMRVAAEVPGLTPAALLGASGGANDAVLATLDRQVEGISKRSFFLRLPVTAPRLFLQQARLEREVTAFEPEAERTRRKIAEMDLALLPDDALATTLGDTAKLLDRTGTLMLRCASTSLAAHLILRTAIAFSEKRRARGDASGGPSFDDPFHAPRAVSTHVEHLAQALVGAAQEVDSAGPGLALMRATEEIRADARATERLLSAEVRALADLPDGLGRAAIERFLAMYGDRAVREAELSTPRWKEDPSPVLAMITAALRAPPADPERHLAHARALADREMARLETRMSATEIAIVRKLVAFCQTFTRLRERMRTWVTRVLGLLRHVALDIDRRLRRIDPRLPQGSVFFCTFDELTAALSSGRAEVGPMVRLRQAEHARDAGRPDPPMTFIGRPPPAALPPPEGMRLYGLPASSGVVEGRARVLSPGQGGLERVCAGEILISRTTDVGLTPLFLVAAGVITELGGPLSHAAVVAREYGVPAVVSVPGATTAIRTGERIRLDGDRGIVEKLPEMRGSVPPPPPAV